jgi:hypothetical protein
MNKPIVRIPKEKWHTGWNSGKSKNMTAHVVIDCSHLALANGYMSDNYQGKAYNVNNVDKFIKVHRSHHQIKGVKYCYKLTLENNEQENN